MRKNSFYLTKYFSFFIKYINSSRSIKLKEMFSYLSQRQKNKHDLSFTIFYSTKFSQFALIQLINYYQRDYMISIIELIQFCVRIELMLMTKSTEKRIIIYPIQSLVPFFSGFRLKSDPVIENRHQGLSPSLETNFSFGLEK